MITFKKGINFMIIDKILLSIINLNHFIHEKYCIIYSFKPLVLH